MGIGVRSMCHEIVTDGAASGAFLDRSSAACFVAVTPSGRDEVGGVDGLDRHRLSSAEVHIADDALIVCIGPLFSLGAAEGVSEVFRV